MGIIYDKKIKIFIYSILSIATIGACSVGAYYLVSLIKHLENKENSSEEFKILTNEVVKSNFSENGIWENKASLTSSDLREFTHIKKDAFDNININIESIEIPSTCTMENDDFYSIKWENVSLITLENNKGSSLFIKNNILFQSRFYLGSIRYVALTISDRNVVSDLLLPTIDDFGNKITYAISDNFYNEEVFQNINQIIFDSKKALSIFYFGINSFMGCKKLPIDFSPHFESIFFIFFSENSFKDTNIESTYISISDFDSISSNEKIVVSIEPFAFDSPSLRELHLTSDLFYITSNGFSQTSTDKNIDILIDSKITSFNGDDCFNGKYQNFSLSILAEELDIEKGYTPLSNIDSNIFSMSLSNLSYKEIFKNSGLTDEQYNKIELHN